MPTNEEYMDALQTIMDDWAMDDGANDEVMKAEALRIKCLKINGHTASEMCATCDLCEEVEFLGNKYRQSHWYFSLAGVVDAVDETEYVGFIPGGFYLDGLWSISLSCSKVESYLLDCGYLPANIVMPEADRR